MAQTAPRKVQSRAGTQGSFPTAADMVIFQGAMVALAAGVAIPARQGVGADNAAKAAEAATHTVVGIAEETTRGGSTPGATRVPTKAGTFLFKNAAADPVTLADVGHTVFVIDDETIGKTSPNNIRPKAGTLIDVEDDGAWVRVGA